MKTKEGKEKKNRKFIVLFLSLALALTAGLGYVYWAGLIKGDTDTAITAVQVGHGDEVETTLTATESLSKLVEGKTLVPKAYVREGENEVGEATFKIALKWEGDEITGAVGDLTYNGVKVFKGDPTEPSNEVSSDIESLFKFTGGTAPATLTGNAAAVDTADFNLELLEPATKALYEAIADQEFTFVFTYTVAAQ